MTSNRKARHRRRSTLIALLAAAAALTGGAQALAPASAVAMDDADAAGCTHVPDKPVWWGKDKKGDFCLIAEGAGAGGESGGGASDDGSGDGNSTCSADPSRGPVCYPGDPVPELQPSIRDLWPLPKMEDRTAYRKVVEWWRRVQNCHRISREITYIHEGRGVYIDGRRRVLRGLWDTWDEERCAKVLR